MAASRYIAANRSKRFLDLLILIATAPLVIPAFVVSAILLWLRDGRPLFFRHARVGRRQEPLVLTKFRTMVVNADDLLADDGSVPEGVSRITPVGRWLRRFSLDELPQLLSVLRGKMSLIGPRPLLPEVNDRLSEEQRNLRAEALPGITGLAQLRGRNSLPWSERIAADLEYVRSASLWTDVRLAVETIWAVLRGSGIAADRNPEEVDDL